MQVRLLAGQHLIKAVFFNQAYLKNKIIPGSIVTVTGKWDRGRQVINVSLLFQYVLKQISRF